jgi:hypothetical protein
MSRKPQPATAPADHSGGSSRSDSLADALRTLKESTHALNTAHAPKSEVAPSALPTSGGETPPDDAESRAYYRMLEQTGQLLDVASDADLAALPPRVTHVRRPDGTVERIGFSAT